MRTIFALSTAIVVLFTTLVYNELSASSYKTAHTNDPVVYGHRIGPGGQEYLIIKN